MDWAIGARGTGTERFFKGSIDDAAIWNTALNAAQIQFLRKAARPWATTNLIGTNVNTAMRNVNSSAYRANTFYGFLPRRCSGVAA